MARQVINNGATGGTIRGQLNSMFNELYIRPGALIVPRIIMAGDSKARAAGTMGSISWLAWALMLSGVEYKFNPALDNCGVNGATADNTNNGAATNGSGVATVLGFATDTNIAVIVARVTAAVTAGENPVVWFQIGTNSPGTESGTLAALRKVINACRNAGAVMFLINEIPPLGTLTGTTAGNMASQNTIIRLWCDTQTDCVFINHGIATVAPASAISAPFGTTDVAFSPSYDGIHESGYGAYLEGKFMAPQIARLFRPARVRYLGVGDQYQAWFGAGSFPTAGLGANIVRNPLFTGTGGSDQTSKTGTAAVTGGVPDRFKLTGSISGNITVAFSQVANDLLNALTGRTDLTCARMTISGTPTANDTIQLQVNDVATPSNYPAIPNGTYATLGQTIVRYNALTGIQDHALYCSYASTIGSLSGAVAASNALPALTEVLYANGTDPGSVTVTGGGISTAAPPPNGAGIRLRNGVACSGSIDFMWTDCRLPQSFPAPLT